MGYDPVVNVDWKDPEKQIEYILNNIDDFQEFVDRNYAISLEKASWEVRINSVVEILNELDYKI